MNYVEDLIAKIKKNFLVPLNDFSESEKRLFNPIRQELKQALKDFQKRERERIMEIIRNQFYDFNDKEQDFECNQRVLSLRNKIINKIKELK